MSLTSHLKDSASPVRGWLLETFPHVDRVVNDVAARLVTVHTLRPPGAPQGYPWGTIGTAFDYRMRSTVAITPPQELAVQRFLPGWWQPPADVLVVGPDGIPHEPPSVARWAGLAATMTPAAASRLGDLLPDTLLGVFFSHLEDVTARVNPVGRQVDAEGEDQLGRVCVVLAWLEEIARTGVRDLLAGRSPLALLKPGASLEDLLGLVPQAWCDDLRALSWAFWASYDAHLRPRLETGQTVLNPLFPGPGTMALGGADGDLIVGGCLLELKTWLAPLRVRSKLRDTVLQLLGYVLLDVGDRYRLDAAGLYFARQASLTTWPLHTLLAMATGQASWDDADTAAMRDAFERSLSELPVSTP